MRLPELRRPLRHMTSALVIVGSLVLSPSVQASWISVVGVVSTFVGIGATFIPPGGTVVAGVLGVSEVLLVALDGYLLVTSRGPYRNGGNAASPGGSGTQQVIVNSGDTQPSFLAGNPPPPFTSHMAEFLTAQFPHFDLNGNPDDCLVQATNDMIDCFNQFLAHANQGAADNVIKQDLTNLMNAAQNQATQHDNLVASGYYGTITVNQTDLDNNKQNLCQNGLPQIELNFLQKGGMSNDFIQAYTQNESSVTATLSQPTITVSNLLQSVKDQTAKAAAAF